MAKFIISLVEYIKTPEGFLVLITIVVAIYFGVKSMYKNFSNGGRGGNAKASGLNSVAIGGKGGGGGPGGKGGDGGSGETIGDNSFTMGGEGGEAGQVDRGGKGGRGPLHVLMEDYSENADEVFKTFGITEEMAKKYGKGDDGASPNK